MRRNELAALFLFVPLFFFDFPSAKRVNFLIFVRSLSVQSAQTNSCGDCHYIIKGSAMMK